MRSGRTRAWLSLVRSALPARLQAFWAFARWKWDRQTGGQTAHTPGRPWEGFAGEWGTAETPNRGPDMPCRGASRGRWAVLPQVLL